MNRIDAITSWAQREFAAHRVPGVVQDLVDVASGNRPGSSFEKAALARIFPQDAPADDSLVLGADDSACEIPSGIVRMEGGY